MDCCIQNIFECGEKYSKEYVTMDCNSPQIYDKYPDEEYELCKQVLEDGDESFFGQIQKAIDFTKERFIVLTLSLEEQNPYVDFLGVEKYLFPKDKLDTDVVPLMDMNGLCLEKKSEELKGKRNLGSMDEYTDLFVTLASCNVLWQNKLQIKIRSARFITSKKILVRSMPIPHVLLKIKGWKGMIGHPIDRGTYAKLKPNADLLDHCGFSTTLDIADLSLFHGEDSN